MIKTSANSTLAIGGVSSPFDSFEVVESSVLRIKFSAEKPAHRQSAKRWRTVQETPKNQNMIDKEATIKEQVNAF